MAPPRILLVEDDRILIMMLTEGLRAEGYVVESVTRGDEALAAASRSDADLILLDVTLPGKDGFAICAELRERGVATPVVMLTSRDELDDRVRGLNAGADDYLTKPFDMSELAARIEALLRRVQNRWSGDIFDCGDLRVDFRRATVLRGGEEVSLSAIELKLLRYFIEHRGEILSREQLLDDVWGYASEMITRTVDAHVRFLRKKIERNPSRPEHIVTVHGLGYRFLPGSS